MDLRALAGFAYHRVLPWAAPPALAPLLESLFGRLEQKRPEIVEDSLRARADPASFASAALTQPRFFP